MNPQVVLCADTESLIHPELIGLEGENLQRQPWLQVFNKAEPARAFLQGNDQAEEIWVASSDDVDPINLAAALKKDQYGRGVYLLAFTGSGSLRSRASAAGIDGMLTKQDFADRYACRKQGGQQAKRIAGTEKLFHAFEAGAGSALQRQQGPERTGGGSPHVAAGTMQRRPAFVLPVVSASGGAGKSTLSVLMALFTQGLGHRTLLLDADLQFGDMHYVMGVENPLTIDQAICDPASLSRLRAEECNPAILAAPKHLEQSELVVRELPRLLDYLKTCFDVIIVNTGAFWAEQHAMLLEAGTKSLFIVDQRPSSLHACRHALDLCTRCGIATHPFVFALNRCSRSASLSSIDVSCALNGAHTVELPDGGREVGELLGAGLPFELIKTRNDLCKGVEQVLLDLLPKTETMVKRALPSANSNKRFRLSRRRRKVACL